MFSEPVAEDGGEPVGVLHVGQMSAVGDQDQPSVGQPVDRGLGMVGG